MKLAKRLEVFQWRKMIVISYGDRTDLNRKNRKGFRIVNQKIHDWLHPEDPGNVFAVLEPPTPRTPEGACL